MQAYQGTTQPPSLQWGGASRPKQVSSDLLPACYTDAQVCGGPHLTLWRAVHLKVQQYHARTLAPIATEALRRIRDACDSDPEQFVQIVESDGGPTTIGCVFYVVIGTFANVELLQAASDVAGMRMSMLFLVC